MRGRASVLGAGVGGLTVASMLARHGWDVEIRDATRRPPPALVLNEIAQMLLEDVFGPRVLDGGHVLRERRVRWGAGAAGEIVVPTRSVAVDGGVLLARLRARTHSRPCRMPDWVVDGTGRRDDRTTFGRRCVIQGEVSLAASGSCSSWLESVEAGWVHLAPLGRGRGVIQAMVPAPPADPAGDLRRMTAGTTDIKHQFVGAPGNLIVFPAAPTLSPRVAAPGWLSVADAAVTVDPISGFGTAWALRGGILAAAVMDACVSGLPEDACLDHYAERLRQAIGEHVDHCLRFYGDVFSTPAWKEELASMASARRAVAERGAPPSFAFRLNGFRLEASEGRPAGR